MQKIRVFIYLVLVAVSSAAVSCGGAGQPASPVETLKAYTIALRNKDITMMKMLLSEATIKLHQDEAKARGITLDEVIQQQTLFPADQRFFDYRNEKIEGEKASVEVKNSFGGWDTVFLIKEGGAWKIDRKGTSDQMIRDIEEQNKKLDEMIDDGLLDPAASPTPDASPTVDGTDPFPDPAQTPGTSPTPDNSDNKAAGQSPPPPIN